MTWLSNRLVLGALLSALVMGAFAVTYTVGYRKGFNASESDWKLKYSEDIRKMYESGQSATKKALDGWNDDLKKYRNRKPAPVIRLCDGVPHSTGGVDAAAPEGQPGAVGTADERGRTAGRITAEILDSVDLEAARCGRLIEWLRSVKKPSS